jgi:hypothetical protein
MKTLIFLRGPELRASATLELRDRALDIRIRQLIRPRLQMGDETPDIRLRPALSAANGDGVSRDETLDIRIGQLIYPAPAGGR